MTCFLCFWINMNMIGNLDTSSPLIPSLHMAFWLGFLDCLFKFLTILLLLLIYCEDTQNGSFLVRKVMFQESLGKLEKLTGHLKLKCIHSPQCVGWEFNKDSTPIIQAMRHKLVHWKVFALSVWGNNWLFRLIRGPGTIVFPGISRRSSEFQVWNPDRRRLWKPLV